MKRAELIAIALPVVLPMLLPCVKACVLYLYGLAQYKATYLYIYSSAALHHPVRVYTFVPANQEAAQQIIQSEPQALHKLQCPKSSFGVPPGYRARICCYAAEACVGLLVEDGAVAEKFLLRRGGRYRLIVDKGGARCVRRR